MKFYRYTQGLTVSFVAVDKMGTVQFELQQIDLLFTIDGDPGYQLEEIMGTVSDLKELTWTEFQEKAGLVLSTASGLFADLRPKTTRE